MLLYANIMRWMVVNNEDKFAESLMNHYKNTQGHTEFHLLLVLFCAWLPHTDDSLGEEVIIRLLDVIICHKQRLGHVLSVVDNMVNEVIQRGTHTSLHLLEDSSGFVSGAATIVHQAFSTNLWMAYDLKTQNILIQYSKSLRSNLSAKLN